MAYGMQRQNKAIAIKWARGPLGWSTGLLVLLAACMTGLATVHAGDIGRSQGFFDLEVRKALSERWSVFVNHQSKFQDEDSVYFLWHIKGGLRYEAAYWLQLAADHRHQEDRNEGDWLRESRSTLEATLKTKIGDWKLSSRNRMEYRDFEGGKPDRWRYRNQIKIARGLPLGEVTGYFSEEPQYDFERDRWFKHRITAGVTRPVVRRVKLQLYYRWDVIEQSKQHGNWYITQILGVKLVMDLD